MKRDIKIGKDSRGRFSVQIEMDRDDPLKDYIVALAQRAAHKVQDTATGFTYEKEAKDGTPQELEDLLLKLLPEDLQHRFVTESAALKKEAIGTLINSDLSGLLGLMTGNIFQQQDALKDNPLLNNFESLGGSLKTPIDRMLGGTIFADETRAKIQDGTFDSILKPETPEPSESLSQARDKD